MKWTTEADEAIKKVPFFVRNKVRGTVEREALRQGRRQITLAEVESTRKRYLSGMQSEIKGYQLDACFGPSGCPNAVAPSRDLMARIEELLQKSDFMGFLHSKGVQDLKYHHEFRVTMADCPNACSQPQIKDIGIIGARRPGISEISCTACRACVDICRESAITVDNSSPAPQIETLQCVACGQCIPVCPSGTLKIEAEGYRIQLGGKLGRHPRLALELPGIYDADATMEIVGAGIEIYKSRNRRGERFGEILKPEDIQALAARFAPKAL